jgi:hypothetical protein
MGKLEPQSGFGLVAPNPDIPRNFGVGKALWHFIYDTALIQRLERLHGVQIDGSLRSTSSCRVKTPKAFHRKPRLRGARFRAALNAGFEMRERRKPSNNFGGAADEIRAAPHPKTARAVGLAVPESFLVRADEVTHPPARPELWTIAAPIFKISSSAFTQLAIQAFDSF